MKKSLNFISPGEIAIIEEPLPELKVGECLIRNSVSLISPGTELALFTGTHVGFKDPDIAWAKFPLLPGYATAGIVEACNGVKDLQVGDCVTYYGPHSTHGIINTESDVWAKIPESMMENALFGRFAQISGTVPYLAEKRRGNALVFGAGLIGNFCAQLLQLQEREKVLIVDISAKRLALASTCGIERTINSAETGLSEAVMELTGGEGVDLIVEATGVPSLVGTSLELINFLGSVYLLGSSRGEVCINAYKHIHRKGVSLIGAHESIHEKLEIKNSPTPVRDRLREMIDLLEKGELSTKGMITHRITPKQAKEYYNHLLNDRDHYLGIIINWRGL